ncbi:MAG: hypothetical protein JXA71_01415 [Chitinispirillaceae bacterium]|nr:hypothetical protein [Chitinispirillaceae bacterium]
MGKKIVLFGALIAIVLLSGCYTQLRQHAPMRVYSGYESSGAPAEATGPDTFFIVVDTVFRDGDTLFDTTWYDADERLPDSVTAPQTVIVEPRERDYCFWIRDFLGYPELRCFSSYAEYQFYVSSSAPWWYRDNYMFGYSYYGCPPGYHFDPFTRHCRYFSDFNRYYYPRFRGQVPNRRSAPSDMEPARRYRSYTPPDAPPPSGGSAVEPKRKSGAPPSVAPERRRGRSEASPAPSGNPRGEAKQAQPRDQGSTENGRREGDAGQSSNPRKDPRRQ